MLTTVLVIKYKGQDLLALFDDDDAAWAALVRFVDKRWKERFGGKPRPKSSDERVETFFQRESMYFLANAEVAVPAGSSHYHSANDPCTKACRAN